MCLPFFVLGHKLQIFQLSFTCDLHSMMRKSWHVIVLAWKLVSDAQLPSNLPAVHTGAGNARITVVSRI